MSHFTVAVFSDGRKMVEELLAPYQENNMGVCPKEYLEFVSATEREREVYERAEKDSLGFRYDYGECVSELDRILGNMPQEEWIQ